MDKGVASQTGEIKEGVAEKVTSEQSPEGGEGVNQGDDRDKSVAGRRNSEGKGSDMLGERYPDLRGWSREN